MLRAASEVQPLSLQHPAMSAVASLQAAACLEQHGMPHVLGPNVTSRVQFGNSPIASPEGWDALGFMVGSI
jgi:hypothetical protein